MKTDVNPCSPSSKQKKGFWVKSFICIAMVITLLCINSLSAMNAVAQAALTPLAYYQKIEKSNLNKQVDTLTKYYADYIANYQTALKQQIGLETTIQATFDSSLTDDTSMEGLNSVKASIISMVNGGDSKTSGVISLNNKDLTSFELFTSLNDLYYFLIPNLSKAYLKMDIKNMEGYTSSAALQESISDYLNDPISEDSLNKLLKKYGTVIIDNIDNVIMKKNINLSLDGVKSNYSRLTLSINELNALNISNAILNAAKKDADLKELFVDLGVCTNSEYDKVITEQIANITSSIKDMKKNKSKSDTIFKMSIWIDGKGNIAGRSFASEVDDEVLSIGYRTTKSGTKIGVEAWINSNKKDILRATGSFAYKLTGASGNLKVSLSDSTFDAPTVIDIDFKDAKYTMKDFNSFINAKFAITSESLNGMSINIDCSGEAGKQDYLFDILYNNESIASVSTMSKEVPYVAFNLPSSNDKVYDIETQLEDYMKDADIKGFLEGIKEKSDLEFIDSYIDSILVSYTAQ